MRTLAALTAVFCVLAPCAQAEIRYTGASARDPFSQDSKKKTGLKDADEGAVAIEKQLQTMTIEGLVASSNNPRAIINGKIYRAGEELKPGLKIKSINKNGVLLVSGEKEMLLTQQKKRKMPDDPAKKA